MVRVPSSKVIVNLRAAVNLLPNIPTSRAAGVSAAASSPHGLHHARLELCAPCVRRFDATLQCRSYCTHASPVLCTRNAPDENRWQQVAIIEGINGEAILLETCAAVEWLVFGRANARRHRSVVLGVEPLPLLLHADHPRSELLDVSLGCCQFVTPS